MLTRSVKKESGSKTESYELNSHPLGTLFKFQSGCRQETNQRLVKVPLHGRCSRDALRCQHTLVHCLSWMRCMPAIPASTASNLLSTAIPKQLNRRARRETPKRFCVYYLRKQQNITVPQCFPQICGNDAKQHFFFLKLPFGIQMPSFSYCCLFLTETHRGQ